MKNSLTEPQKQVGALAPPRPIDTFPGLTAATRRVYGALVEHCRDKAYCFPRRKTLAKAADVSLSSVARALDVLEGHGLIARLAVYDHGQRRSSVYRLKDLSEIDGILNPPADRETPRQYVPGQPQEKKVIHKTFETVAQVPINPTQSTPSFSPGKGMERPSPGHSLPQERRSPRQTHRQPCQPKSPAEAAIWCKILDAPICYSDWPGNRKRLRRLVDLDGVEGLRRLVDLALQPRIANPGGYLQTLLTRRLALAQG